jgi:hypothetical protein
MTRMPSDECSRCSSSDPRMTLSRCPICHKLFCDKCQYAKGGRVFCAQYCADYFFFGDDE